jgi:hypothetical protein
MSMGRDCPWTAATKGPIIHPLGDIWWVLRLAIEWYWQGKPEGFGEKPVPLPLCKPQITHGLTRERTLVSAMKGLRLTTWDGTDAGISYWQRISPKMAVFWDTVPQTLVYIDRRFRRWCINSSSPETSVIALLQYTAQHRRRALPACHRGGPGSRPHHSMWDLWWAKGHWDRFIYDFFRFLLSVWFQHLHNHLHHTSET